MNKVIRIETVDRLKVEVHPTRAAMGSAAASACRRRILEVLTRRASCRMIFAAAPSQNEMLAGLRAASDTPWERIEAFHMDEYLGLPAQAPQRFSNFLRQTLFDLVPLKAVHLLDTGGLPIADEMKRYASLLNAAPIDLVCLGVGENGHIAFNDPPVADFDDPFLVKEVVLDEVCRLQQVNDGAFASLEAVPQRAITLTVPALMRGESLFCVVPGPRKAMAVKTMLTGLVDESCPASVLRRHPDCTLYLDAESASMWLETLT
ncbi:MAG: glucosamine-6-phosphate deaminase [Deltaproteobacteria bacterium]|nr:glucosamine-6-phosphate deaminase [Deltaproteobacteria bacterium]